MNPLLHAISIKTPDTVIVYPVSSNNTAYIKDGEDYEVTIRAIDGKTNIATIQVDGSIVAMDRTYHTFVIQDIRESHEIVIETGDAVTASRAAYSSANTASACCGVKHLSLTKMEDGSISASLTGLEADVEVALATIMKSDYDEYTITSWRKEGANITVTAVSDISNTFEKVKRSAIFKTIPGDIYDTHTEGLVTRSMQSPLEAPDSSVFIRRSNMYGTDGWTVKEIIDELGIDAYVPANFNYHVYQMSANRGSPVMSVLHSLLPIPGLIIERQNGRYYINIANGTGAYTGTICEFMGESTKTEEYDTTVAGVPGEPLYIEDEYIQPLQEDNTTTILNLVGGVWGLVSSVSTSSNDVDRIEEMFRD